MKLTFVLLTVAFLNVSAKSISQTVTYSGTNVELQTVLEEVEKQTGYVFFFNESQIKGAKKITVHANNEDLKVFLDKVFIGQPLAYRITNKNIIIKSLEEAVDLGQQRTSPSFNSPPVSGVIRDVDGNPLQGVNIVVKGTGKGTVTDSKGEFVLRDVDEKAVLEVSFVGFVPQAMEIAGRTSIDIVLKKGESKLDEVQVIAYGTTTRRLSTGNVNTVKANDIAKAPVNNPLLALAGRVPGLMIAQANGVPGGPVTVRIQGANSIRQGNDPFYVIDGVPFFTEYVKSVAPVYGGTANALSFINPSDIESIDILKDADATAIYGSQAANGAIIITTKKGKAGRLKIDMNTQHGIGQITRKLKVLNTQEYLAMRREAVKNDGLTIPSTPTPAYYDLTLYDQNRYTDWQKELIGKPAKYTDAQVGVSGGTANLSGTFSVNYHEENTAFAGESSNEKLGAHFGLSGNSSNRKFQFNFTGSYLIDNNKLPGNDLTKAAVYTTPNAPALYDGNGNLNWEIYNGYISWVNPLSQTLKRSLNKTTNLVSNLGLSYEILRGLQLKTTIGYVNRQSDNKLFNPNAIYGPFYPFNNRSASYVNSNDYTWNIEPQLSYQLASSFGNLDFLVGSTFQEMKSNAVTTIASGFSDDSQLENISFATNINALIEHVNYNYNALFGRFNYNYKDKYLLNLSGRRDGSSRFGPKNMFNNFYSIGGAWLFSEERWFQENSILSFGKVKMSYGASGSDKIGDYAFMDLYSPYNEDISYGGGRGLTPIQHSNPYLEWEETRKLNMGLDLGFINDRILLGLNYYRNRSSNQLLRHALPVITGFSIINQNSEAKVQNSGIEFSLKTLNVKLNNFSWSSEFNIAINKNKLIEYENLSSSYDRNLLVIGEPITITRAYTFAGVDAQSGLYQFKKADGDLTSFPDPVTDQYAFKNTVLPKYFGGLNNSFSYKGLTLDFLFYFVKQLGFDETRIGNIIPGYFSLSALSNQPISVLNSWKKPGDESNVQRFSTGINGINTYFLAQSSTATIVDASYIRLKNVSLSWSLPEKWINKAHFHNVRLYFHGQNLLTFTSYKGLDPETQYFVLPPLRVCTFGIQLTL